jgi:Tol biopolymer transport system component
VLFTGLSTPQVVVGPGQALVGISVSLEGQLAYAVGLGEGSAEIRIRSLDGKPAPFTVPPLGADQYPAWSPRADKIAFTDGRSIEVFDTKTRTISKVTSPPGPCDDSLPTWWPGGTKLGFFRACSTGTRAGIYEVDLRGTHLTRIRQASLYTNYSKPWPGTSIRGAPIGLSWSPDGASMAFEMRDGALWLVSAKFLPHQGQRIADLKMVIGPDRSRPKGEGFGFGTVAWSHDGLQLAFVRDGAVVTVDLSRHLFNRVAGTVGLQPGAISWT